MDLKTKISKRKKKIEAGEAKKSVGSGEEKINTNQNGNCEKPRVSLVKQTCKKQKEMGGSTNHIVSHQHESSPGRRSAESKKWAQRRGNMQNFRRPGGDAADEQGSDSLLGQTRKNNRYFVWKRGRSDSADQKKTTLAKGGWDRRTL